MRRPRRQQRFQCSAPFLVFLLAVVSGCPATKDFDPYLVPREEFQRVVRTIGILPPGVAVSGFRREKVASDIEFALSDLLRKRGYQVVGSDVVGPVWRRYASQIGGLFNPLTGEPDRKKLETARAYVARDLARSHNVDVLAVTWTREGSLMLRTGEPPWPRFDDEVMEFHGQPILDMPQWVTAMWLYLELIEPDGRALYSARVPVQWLTVFVARSYYRRPEHELWPTHKVHTAVRRLLVHLEPAASAATPGSSTH
ncbi:hypothetical protein HRbin30_00501 [bacterium HR30]|nr:hypothetical protein HRbin30_00501 [bacterium HR30]